MGENLGGCLRILPTTVVIIRENRKPLYGQEVTRGQGQDHEPVDEHFEMIISLAMTINICR